MIPTFNRRALLEEAIASALALREGCAAEVVVVDDASTDDSWSWLSSLATEQVRVFRMDRNGGQSRARNAGIERARGDRLLFLDSDDILEPDAIVEGLRAAQEEGDDITVFGWGTVSLDEPRAAGPTARRTWAAPRFTNVIDDVLAGRAVPTSAALYRREYVRPIQWDQGLRKLDDWGWFCQAALLGGRISSVDRVAYWMRGHAGSRATTAASMLLNATEHHMVLAKIERRLRETGELTGGRQRRLAQYYYKELRVLSLHDRLAFEAAVAHIRELDPAFRPVDEERQWWMRVVGRSLGFRRAVLLHSWFKRRFRRPGYSDAGRRD